MKNLLFVFFTAGALFSAAAGETGIRIPVCSEGFTIDGKLDEAFYKNTAPMRLNRLPAESNFLKNKTFFWICADDTDIHIGVRCFESNPKELLRAETLDNGTVYKDDCVEIFLTPDAARSDYYYHFIVNPLGTKYETHRNPDGAPVHPSSFQWKAAASVSDDSWSAEFQIPRSMFQWGKESSFNICRSRKAGATELSSLAILDGNRFAVPEKFLPVKWEKEKEPVSIRNISELFFFPGQRKNCEITVDNGSGKEKNIKAVLEFRSADPKEKPEIFEKACRLKGHRDTVLSLEYSLTPGKRYSVCALSVFADDKLLFSWKTPIPEYFTVVFPGRIYYKGETLPPLWLSGAAELPEKYHYRVLLSDRKTVRTLLDNIKYDKEVEASLATLRLPEGGYVLTTQLCDPEGKVVGEVKKEMEIIDI